MIEILVILAATVAAPIFVYYTIRAARSAWLRAEQDFFTNPDNHKDK